MREASPSYEFGPFRLDVPEHVLLRDGDPVQLTPKNFDVLCVLVENSGHLVEKERLLKEVWPDSFVEEGALNRSVSVLRKALGDSPSGQKYIETVPKRGYRFVAPVTVRLSAGSWPVPASSGRPAVGIEVAQPDSQSLPKTRGPAAGRTLISKLAAGIGAVLMVGVLAYVGFGSLEPRTDKPETRAPAHTQVTFTGKEGFPTLSPDGRRIAYVSAEKPEKKLMVQELTGGQPLAVFTAPEIGYMRWSPDGSELVIFARGSGKNGVYILPQLGGVPRWIAPGQFIACWSPDGSMIAVGSYMLGKIWLIKKNGQLQRTFTLQGDHGSIYDIDWSSANGRLMVVSDDTRGGSTIWTVEADGSDQKAVLREDTEVPVARWAPGGAAIYYFRRLNQTVSLNKVLLQPDDQRREPIATSLISGLETDRMFGLSADGTRLVYARAPYYSHLWALESRGDADPKRTEPRQLTHGTSHIERPRVSPDGTSIVLNIGYQPMTELYTMPLTGGTPKQLTFLNAFSVGGAWSPDGKSVAFASTRGGTPRVWTVAAGGGLPRALSSRDLSEGSLDLTWAAGSRILYHQKGHRNYYELDPTTQEARPLIRDSSVGWIFSPVYSPDGAKIAVSWNRPPTQGIWVIDTKDRHETLVYKASADTSMPIGWSADGSAIYVVEGKPCTFRDLSSPLGETVTEARILMVPLNGGEVKTVARLPFEEIGGVAMTPDASTFVFTVYTSRSDVWLVDNFDTSPEGGARRRWDASSRSSGR
jgi:Tol biopolymer transport system component/DNA-binding winged helix-turn-helix (wHTH) protein